MKKIVMTTTILFTTACLLVACSDDAEENEKNEHTNESQTADEQKNEGVDKSTDETEDSSETPSKEDQNGASEESEQEHANRDESAKDDGIKLISEQEKYLEKLTNTKKETNDMRENPKDETTFALKEVEGNIYDVWDGLLNDIYGELETQLSSEEMDELRNEQREWIELRDHTAKEESLKYEGGTAEQLEYVKVENNLTIERCFELVEEYLS